MKTTLNKIRYRSPCKGGWNKLLAHLGKTKADKEPLPLLTILEVLGLDDTLWCLRAVEGHEKEKRLLAVAFVRRVQHLLKDPRSVAALDMAERCANGAATDEELKAARTAARDAAWAAPCAAYAAWAAAAAADAAAEPDAVAAVGAASRAAAWAVDASLGAASWAAFYAREASANPAAELEAQTAILREMLTAA